MLLPDRAPAPPGTTRVPTEILSLLPPAEFALAGALCGAGVAEDEPGWATRERAMSSSVVRGRSASSMEVAAASEVLDWAGIAAFRATCLVSSTVAWWPGLITTVLAELPATSTVEVWNSGAASAGAR